MTEHGTPPPALEAIGVSKHYHTGGILGRNRRLLRALDDVDVRLYAGQTHALVGESGSGKSTLTRLLARLESPTSGELLLHGQKLAGRAGGSLRRYSGEVQLVLQDPYASLSPTHKVSYILGRPLAIHKARQPREIARLSRRAQAEELLERVQLSPARGFLDKYPHELSGGQRQRVAIARALAARPAVLLADEPVSMLDVSIRLGLLTLLTQIKEEEGLALLYVTHDIASARYFADKITVLYAGQAVESGDPDNVILNPQHPYTKLLVESAPDPLRAKAAVGRIPVGEPPSLISPPSGCRFHPRCPVAMPECRQGAPPAFPVKEGEAWAKCWLHRDASEPLYVTHLPMKD